MLVGTWMMFYRGGFAVSGGECGKKIIQGGEVCVKRNFACVAK